MNAPDKTISRQNCEMSLQRHTKFEKLAKAALFIWLGVLSTLLNPPRNGAFRKRSSNRRTLKTPALHFSVGG